MATWWDAGERCDRMPDALSHGDLRDVSTQPCGRVLGIDASNLRQGGGHTHLIELLRAACPAEAGFSQVIVWGAQTTLALLEDRPWLIKYNPPALEGGLVRRSLWQRFALPEEARRRRCDVLLVPGGNVAGNFRPVVTMCRNMLPFEWAELKRYGWTWMTLRLLILRWAQSRSFKRANGVIFLTRYAQAQVGRATGDLQGLQRIIPHGLNPRFIHPTRVQKPIEDYSPENPFRILYVSIIDQYKHQWHVVAAVGALRQKTGWPLTLDLVGPAYPPAMARLKAALLRWDPTGHWVSYHGTVPYSALHEIYGRADLGLFASSCENMPNTLLETMATGLPVVSSACGPMPEILGDAGVYFDPQKPAEIAVALERLIGQPDVRAESAAAGSLAAQRYTWQGCASETFGFLSEVHRKFLGSDVTCAG